MSWARRAIDFRWIFSCGLNENEVYSEANSCRSSAKKARFTRIYRMSKELKNIFQIRRTFFVSTILRTIIELFDCIAAEFFLSNCPADQTKDMSLH